MNEVTLLTDYQGRFGSKDNSTYYRGGMDLDILSSFFKEHDIEITVKNFAEIDFRKPHQNKIYLYTSQEDAGYEYKSYIEDVIDGLTVAGAIVIPEWRYLRANNNKVFMEILRDIVKCDIVKNIRSWSYGTYEEFEKLHYKRFSGGKSVVKRAGGSGSTGVFGASSFKELDSTIRKHMRSRYYGYELWDFGRSLKHKGYRMESKHRTKHTVQNLVEGMTNDWKVLIFGSRYYIFSRPNRKNDFRASGSGHAKYLYNEDCPIPEGIFDYAEQVYQTLDVPHLSIDIGFDGEEFCMIEFQAIYFGSVGHAEANFYHTREGNEWKKVNESLALEQVYAEAAVEYINKKNLLMTKS